MKTIACFDVGGTFIKYGVVNEEGDILFKSKFPSPKENCKVNIPKLISEKTKELQKEYDICCIGICTAGQVDSEKGEIVFATENLPGYTGAKIYEDLKRLTGLESYVENDVNAVGLGEMWKGAGKGKDTFVCMALGTGIGGAIIIDGKLYKGVYGGAGEVGHAITNEGGEPCNCGSKGCYERYASTSALIRQYAKRANIHEDSINGEELMNRVRNGEKLAVEVYNEFLKHVVAGLVTITHILDPGLIAIGGGISAQGKPFFDEINELFKKEAMPSYAERTKIVPAELKNDAGLIGACYAAIQNCCK